MLYYGVKMPYSITKIAMENNPDLNLLSNLSLYGFKNDKEFFAECFTNCQLGQPNELGAAMHEWLIRKGY